MLSTLFLTLLIVLNAFLMVIVITNGFILYTNTLKARNARDLVTDLNEALSESEILRKKLVQDLDAVTKKQENEDYYNFWKN